MNTHDHEHEHEHTCTECGAVISNSDYCCDYHNENAPHLCTDCFHENYFYCDDCEAYYAIDDVHYYEVLHSTNNSHTVCDSCYEYYNACEVCGYDYGRDIEYSSIMNGCVCDSCKEDNDNIIRCCNCEQLFDADTGNGRCAIDVDEWYCDRCSGDLYYCDHCGVYYRDGHCPECGGDGEDLLHTHSYKPKTIFYSTRKELYQEPHMGVELEYSFSTYSDRDALVEYRSESTPIDDIFYAKQDNSIANYGVEFVSHPCTLAYWQTPKMRTMMSDLFTKAKEHDVTIGTTCGYHVHISRKDMTRLHLVRFCLFFAMNKELVEAIARRPTDIHYSKLVEYDKSSSLSSYSNSYSKYVCVNLQHEDTIEVRCFRGTYNSANFYSALEFVHSVYMFTKHHASVAMCNNKKELFSSYLLYLQNNKMYSTLFRTIVNDCSYLLYWTVDVPVIPLVGASFTNMKDLSSFAEGNVRYVNGEEICA